MDLLLFVVVAANAAAFAVLGRSIYIPCTPHIDKDGDAPLLNADEGPNAREICWNNQYQQNRSTAHSVGFSLAPRNGACHRTQSAQFYFVTKARISCKKQKYTNTHRHQLGHFGGAICSHQVHAALIRRRHVLEGRPAAPQYFFTDRVCFVHARTNQRV